MTLFFTVFITVFLAELGDKTQLATILFAADNTQSKFVVFASAASALVLSTAIAILAGAMAERYLAFIPLKLIAGLGFLVIGVMLIAENFATS